MPAYLEPHRRASVLKTLELATALRRTFVTDADAAVNPSRIIRRRAWCKRVDLMYWMEEVSVTVLKLTRNAGEKRNDFKTPALTICGYASVSRAS